jgi:hypothetical protein
MAKNKSASRQVTGVRIMNTRIAQTLKLALAGAAIALGAFGAGAAHASNISWSVGINAFPIGGVISNAPQYYSAPVYSPPVYVQPPPVYYAPPPVYYAPRPIYYERPSYYRAPPVYVPAPVYHQRGWGPAPGRWDDRRFHHHDR